MAALQGHLVIHKQSAHDAIQHLHDLSINTSSTNKSFARVPSNAKHDNTKPKKIKMLSVDEVDRMYFNPQEGWDKGIKDI